MDFYENLAAPRQDDDVRISVVLLRNNLLVNSQQFECIHTVGSRMTSEVTRKSQTRWRSTAMAKTKTDGNGNGNDNGTKRSPTNKTKSAMCLLLAPHSSALRPFVTRSVANKYGDIQQIGFLPSITRDNFDVRPSKNWDSVCLSRALEDENKRTRSKETKSKGTKKTRARGRERGRETMRRSPNKLSPWSGRDFSHGGGREVLGCRGFFGKGRS